MLSEGDQKRQRYLATSSESDTWTTGRSNQKKADAIASEILTDWDIEFPYVTEGLRNKTSISKITKTNFSKLIDHSNKLPRSRKNLYSEITTENSLDFDLIKDKILLRVSTS